MTSRPQSRPGRPSPAAGFEDPPNLRFNFIVLLVHGLLGQTGFRLLQAPTFLPTYISLLAGNSAVGIARAVQSLGMFLSPVLSARMVEHRHHVKPLGLLFGGIMRLQILFIGLTALLVPPRYAIFTIWLVLCVWGFTSGLQMVAFNVLLSKTIPAQRRGRLLGLRNSTAGATLFLVSLLGGFLVSRYGFPEGYGWTFLLAFALTSSGLVAVAMLRERSSEEPRAPLPLAKRLREIPGLFHSEPNFTRFVVARFIATAARGAMPFYIIYAGQEYGLSGGRLAALTIAFTMAESVGSLVWGLIADRAGFRAVFMAALSSWLMGTLLLLSWPSATGSYLVFILVGAGHGGFQMSSMNMVLEFGSERDRAMRIAATNSLSEAVGAVCFLASGLMAATVPLPALFLLSMALQVIAIAQMGRVEEPRKKLPTEEVMLEGEGNPRV